MRVSRERRQQWPFTCSLIRTMRIRRHPQCIHCIRQGMNNTVALLINPAALRALKTHLPEEYTRSLLQVTQSSSAHHCKLHTMAISHSSQPGNALIRRHIRRARSTNRRALPSIKDMHESPLLHVPQMKGTGNIIRFCMLRLTAISLSTGPRTKGAPIRKRRTSFPLAKTFRTIIIRTYRT